MARRQIPVHDSMLNNRRPGIMEALAERLGMEGPLESDDGEQTHGATAAASSSNVVAVEQAPDLKTDSSTLTSQGDQEQAEVAPRPRPAAARRAVPPVPKRAGNGAADVEVDARIVAAKGKQALYVRLPREMHEFLEDLSYRLSKTNRDASMTNLVAQAVLDKYPASMEPGEDTE